MVMSLHKLNVDHCDLSALVLAQLVSPDILALLPHCAHLQKDRFPCFWYSEYIKKITEEKQFVISEDHLE